MSNFFGFTWLTGQCSIAGQSSIHKKRSLLEFFLIDPKSHDGLPRWLSGKESTYQCRRHGFDPRVGKIPWRRKFFREFAGEIPWTGESGGLQSMGWKESNTTKQLNKNNKAHYKPQFLLRVLKTLFSKNWFLKSLLASAFLPMML